jgi:hypothetical protein
MRAALAESGVLVVETADPKDVRLLSAEPLPLFGPDMLYAALGAIAGASTTAVAYDYVKRLHDQMRANREAEKAAKRPTIKQPVRGSSGRFEKAPQ